MRLLLLIPAICLLCPIISMSSPGDTTTITAHQGTDMTSYGAYDQWTKFPSKNKSFRNVNLTYTLGCASSGCSEWDYTTRVIALKPTGKIDSTKKQHPNFKVNGSEEAPISVSRNPTYQVYYDTVKNAVDTTQRDSLLLVSYKVEGEGVKPIDTVVRWPAGYFRYTIDQKGNRIDSTLVQSDSTWQGTQLTYIKTSPVFKEIELSRVITPYAGYMQTSRQGFDNSWERKYRFNVTDFRKLLRDSVKIRVFYEGYSSGFSASIRFHFVEGKASKRVSNVQNLYQGGFPYKNPTAFEQNQMPPQYVKLPPDVEQAKVRVIPSGHGFDNNTNCAEFCKKHYKLNVNGNEVARQLMWRNDCGSNPIFPQSGTWLLDRANWCPGSRVITYEHNITDAIKAGNNSFNLDLEPINWNGDQRPSYNFSVQLITYSGTRNSVDAALQAIKAPSNKDVYSRKNPAAMNPEVVVKNKGKKTIQQLAFKYGADGAVNNTYQWDGSLKPMQKQTIEFPTKIKNWRTDGRSPFIVEIEEVNGNSDDNAVNDKKVSEFSAPSVLPKQFVIWLTTNAQAQQNELYIIRANGDTVYQKTSFSNNTRYRDTVNLPNKRAEYRLVLDDDSPNQESPADENGLYYPFLERVGQGSFALREPGQIGKIIKNFNSDFGSQINYHFVTGKAFYIGKNDPVQKSDQIRLYPNPTDGRLTVSTHQAVEQWQVLDQLGRVVYSKKGQSSNGGSKQLNLHQLQPGIYYLNALKDGTVATRKVILK